MIINNSNNNNHNNSNNNNNNCKNISFQKLLLIPGWVRKFSVLILKNGLIWYA